MLQLTSVTVHDKDKDVVVLRDVSLRVDVREVVAVLGSQRSGRTTLLQVAAGLTTPTAGSVSFAGGDGIAMWRGRRGGVSLARDRFMGILGERVIEQVRTPLTHQLSPRRASAIADEALARVGVRDLAEERAAKLRGPNLVRVAIARALVTKPSLLLLDEPLAGLRASETDALLRLLHDLVHNDGISVLMTGLDDADGFAGGARGLILDHGALRGDVAPAGGDVVRLRRSQK